jgi:hypothetical protein
MDVLNPAGPTSGTLDSKDSDMNDQGGPKVREMNRYFESIIPILREMHGIDDAAFWKMVLYWYVTDRIKSKGRLEGIHAVPYDHVAHKEMFRSDRKERLNRNAVDSIVDIAKISHRGQRHKFPVVVLYLTARYIVFKLMNRERGRSRRRVLETLSEQQADSWLKFALLHMPTVLVEDLDFYASVKIDVEDPVDMRKIKNGFAVAYASRKLKGRTTRLMQHGANYGELKDHAGTCIESRLPDEYFTWGWRYADNHVPGQSPRLESFAREYRQYSENETGNTILVALPVNRKDGFEENFSRFLSLLRAKELTDSWQFSIRKKPRKIVAGEPVERDEETLKSIGSEFSMDMGASSPRAIADARLVVVFDHPATMFLESIFVEKPTLAIASTLGEYRQEYLPHVRFLLECGILHQTVESLVERLEGVVEEPAKWWNEVKSSQGYAKYKATYCGWVQADPAG